MRQSESRAHVTLVISCTVTVCTPFLLSSSSSLFSSPHLCPTHDYGSFYRITITDQWGLAFLVRWVLSTIIIIIITFLLPPLPPFTACHFFFFSHFSFLFSERCMGKHTPSSDGVCVCVFASVFEPFGVDADFYIFFFYWRGYQTVTVFQRVMWRRNFLSAATGLRQESTQNKTQMSKT